VRVKVRGSIWQCFLSEMAKFSILEVFLVPFLLIRTVCLLRDQAISVCLLTDKTMLFNVL